MKGGVNVSNKKRMGRPPLDDPKAIKLTVRVEAATMKILDDYCQRNNASRADGVRAGIQSLRGK